MLLSQFDFEGYISLILNMKKEVRHLLFFYSHNFASWQCLATCCQDDTDLGYETLPHPPKSPDLSPTDYHFFKHLNTFLCPKIFHSKGEVETAFKDFLVSKPFEFYYTSVNDLVNKLQKFIDVQGSHFGWLKHCLNSLFQE